MGRCRKMKKKYDGEKIALWMFLLVAVLAFVIMAFPQTPEVEKALNPETKAQTENVTEAQPAKATELYDVPLEEDLQIYIKKLCDDYGVDMPLILAVIGQESNFKADLIGDGGDSIGLMQIQPKWHAEKMDELGVTDLKNPYQNATVGIDLLAELMGRGKGTEWAVTAYNAGEAKADFNREMGIIGEYTEGVLMLREEIANAN